MRARDIVLALTVLALAGALVGSGCGDSGRQLAPIERAELHAFVDRARAAATARDLAGTIGALEALEARVRELRGAGRMDPETAEQLLKYSAVTQLRARSTLKPAPAAADEREAAEPPAALPAPSAGDDGGEADGGVGNDKANGKAKDDGKGKDEGKGNGKGKGKD